MSKKSKELQEYCRLTEIEDDLRKALKHIKHSAEIAEDYRGVKLRKNQEDLEKLREDIDQEIKELI